MPHLLDRKLAFLQPYAAVFIRLAFGYHLIQYSYNDLFELTAGSGNAQWLGSLGVPFPYLMGWVYILTEFVGGVALVLGFQTRWFAIPLLINFIVAYGLVHSGDEYKKSFEAIQMLAVSLFFLFNGSGKLSLDAWIESKNTSL
jgi:putative oxidoreductase